MVFRLSVGIAEWFCCCSRLAFSVQLTIFRVILVLAVGYVTLLRPTVESFRHKNVPSWRDALVSYLQVLSCCQVSPGFCKSMAFRQHLSAVDGFFFFFLKAWYFFCLLVQCFFFFVRTKWASWSGAQTGQKMCEKATKVHQTNLWKTPRNSGELSVNSTLKIIESPVLWKQNI